MCIPRDIITHWNLYTVAELYSSEECGRPSQSSFSYGLFLKRSFIWLGGKKLRRSRVRRKLTRRNPTRIRRNTRLEGSLKGRETIDWVYDDALESSDTGNWAWFIGSSEKAPLSQHSARAASCPTQATAVGSCGGGAGGGARYIFVGFNRLCGGHGRIYFFFLLFGESGGKIRPPSQLR